MRSRVVLEHLFAQGHEVEIVASRRAAKFLDTRFAVWFTQPSDDPEFSVPSTTESHEAPRFTIYNTTTAELLYAWLARHASAAP